MPTLQVSVAAWERPDSWAHSSPVLQREVQPATEVPSPALPAGWPGTEAHLPAAGGEAKYSWGSNQVLLFLKHKKKMLFWVSHMMAVKESTDGEMHVFS